MKKKLLLTLAALVCVVTCAFGLAACGGTDGGDGGKKDLSQYLGTDAELAAMMPTDSKLFEFTLLETDDGEDIAYEVGIDKSASQSEIEAITDWVIPATHDGHKVVQIAEDGFKNAFGERNAYDGTWANVYIQPGIERICEGGLSDYGIYILQLPSTLKVIEENAVVCEKFKPGNGLQVIESGNEISFKGYTYGPEENKYINDPVCFPDSLEYSDLPFSTALNAESGNVKSDDGVYYIGNPNNPYMIAHHYEKVAGKTVTLNANCKIVQNGVFKGYDAAVFSFSDKLTQIGDEAFANSAILSANIPDTVKYIGCGAFENCTALNSAKLPASLTTVHTDSFAGDTNIVGTEYGRCIYIGTSANPHYFLLRGKSYDNLNPDTDKKGYEIHENTKVIAQGAFNDSSLVWDSTLSADNDIDMDAFFETALSLTVPDGVELIGKEALFIGDKIWRSISLPGDWYAKNDYIENNPDRNYDVAQQLSYYVGKNFSEEGVEDGKGVTSIVIRSGYEEIAYGAFAELGVLNELVLPNTIKSIGFNSLQNTTVYGLTIGSNMYSLASASYSNARILTVVSTADGVMQSGGDSLINSAFEGCGNLISVTLDGIKSIGSEAFRSCGNMTELHLSADVTSIGKDAFYGCSSLTDIYFDGTQAQWNDVNKATDWDRNAGNYTVHCSD